MTDRQVFLSIVIMAVITFALRALPFLLFRGKQTPAWLSYLGKVLPFATMGLLIYCLKGTDLSSAAGFLPTLIAGGIVILSFLWKKNTLLSIITGTVVYMLLVQTVF